MSILDTEMMIYGRCRDLLEEWGISDTNCTMVLFAMCDGDISYDDALTAYAEHRGIARQIMHSNLCYTLLAGRVDVSPRILFEFLKWKGGQTGEN